MTADILHISDWTENDIDRIVTFIKEDKVVIMPCDTICGFIAKRSQENRVRQIKHRDTKPFLYLISDLAQLCCFDIDYNAYSDILKKNWPDNITFIMANRSKTATFGVRMPNHAILQRIIRSVGEPVLSTSVNVSGQPALNDYGTIVTQFGDEADLIVDDEHFVPTSASTIADLTCGEPKIIRQGGKTLVL